MKASDQEERDREEDRDTARLVDAAQRGDRAAFTALYSRFFDRVYGYMRIILRDAHEAEDAAQEVFFRALKALPKYEARGTPFRAWLFTIARNYSIQKLRKSKSLEVTEPESMERYLESQGPAEIEPWLLGWISDPDLVLFLQRLPVAQRQVLVLRFMLDLSTAEIAEVLGRSEVDIRGLQHRALAFLRVRLAAVGRSTGRAERARTRRRFQQAPVLRWRRFALRAP